MRCRVTAIWPSKSTKAASKVRTTASQPAEVPAFSASLEGTAFASKSLLIRAISYAVAAPALIE
jgi:hypothetical protein